MEIKDIVIQLLRGAFPSFAGVITGDNTEEEPLHITCNIESENCNELFEVTATVEDGHLTYLDGYGCVYWSEAADKLKKYKDVIFNLITAGVVNCDIRIVGD